MPIDPVRRAPFKHSVGLDLLPLELSYAERFRMAVEAGFEGIEMEAVAERDQAEEVGGAATAAGLAIHSVLAHENWRHPLSSSDPGEVRKGLQALLRALDNAQTWGADTLLLIPALVDASTSYLDAYTRSQAMIRNELLPAARERGVILGIENVWNGFLLGPLEYVRYIDELESPWVRAYVDVGNMLLSHPEDWIRIAGHRIVKLHMKDLRVDHAHGRFSFGKIGDGSVNWAAVRAALLEVGFASYVTSTGVPRDRSIRWLERGRNLVRRHGPNSAAGGRLLDRPLKGMQRQAERSFLADVAQRFERLRDGRLDPPLGH